MVCLVIDDRINKNGNGYTVCELMFVFLKGVENFLTRFFSGWALIVVPSEKMDEMECILYFGSEPNA